MVILLLVLNILALPTFHLSLLSLVKLSEKVLRSAWLRRRRSLLLRRRRRPRSLRLRRLRPTQVRLRSEAEKQSQRLFSDAIHMSFHFELLGFGVHEGQLLCTSCLRLCILEESIFYVGDDAVAQVPEFSHPRHIPLWHLTFTSFLEKLIRT
jgi:hypothetical protein